MSLGPLRAHRAHSTETDSYSSPIAVPKGGLLERTDASVDAEKREAEPFTFSNRLSWKTMSSAQAKRSVDDMILRRATVSIEA